MAANTWGIDIAKLLEVHAQLDGRVTYKLGGKANPRTTEPEDITSIDCSGYVRYVLYRASDGKVDCSPKGGTYFQQEWCKANLSAVAYDEANAGALDDVLRIAFKKPGGIGHVWLIYKGETLESYGHHGVGRQPWANRSSIAGSCFAF